VVIALGGGSISDVAGFAAATYLRGIPWIALPSTILGMADAAIGGKTGINVAAGKNLAGAIHHPLAILADLEALESLPQEAYCDGWAEVVKAGILGDEALFNACVDEASGVRARDSAIVERLLVAAMRVKIAVVESDSEERSRREILNFGHTAAHALERAVPGLSHGRAVAIGMAAEADLAEQRGRLPSGTSQRILAACASLGVNARLPERLDEAAFEAVSRIRSTWARVASGWRCPRG
jgi:3-dehydroquinate synthase